MTENVKRVHRDAPFVIALAAGHIRPSYFALSHRTWNDGTDARLATKEISYLSHIASGVMANNRTTR